MIPHYTLQWLKDKIAAGDTPTYLFFRELADHGQQPAGPFCFSQWHVSPFMVGAIQYKSVEHWMMAQKAHIFNDRDTFHKILDAETPKEAIALSEQIDGIEPSKWDDVRYDLIRFGCLHKFSQHPELADYLISTGNEVLAKASPEDEVWGIGMSQNNPDIHNALAWRGQNLLGFALMEVREFLREHGPVEPDFQSDLYPKWDFLVTVISFNSLRQLSIAKKHLENAGIESFKRNKLAEDEMDEDDDPDIVQIKKSGVHKLQVNEQDAARAIEVLKNNGYLKEGEQSLFPFLNQLDKYFSKLPYINRLPMEIRLMIVLTMLFTMLLAIMFFFLDWRAHLNQD